MADFDGVAKALLSNLGPILWRRLTGSVNRGRPYDKELDPGRPRTVDHLFELDEDRFLHVEIQARADADMGWRMLRYHVLIRDAIARERAKRDGKPAPRPEVVHWVIHLGKDDRQIPSAHDENGVRFAFNVLDLRQEDPRPFLATGRPWDAILAILCKNGDKRDIVRIALERIAGLALRDVEEAKDALATLAVLGGLRGIVHVIDEEVERMNIEIDVGTSRLIRKPIERAHREGVAEGRVEGMASSAVTFIGKRFHVDLSDSVVEAMYRADEETIRGIMNRILESEDLNEVLGPDLAALQHGSGFRR